MRRVVFERHKGRVVACGVVACDCVEAPLDRPVMRRPPGKSFQQPLCFPFVLDLVRELGNHFQLGYGCAHFENAHVIAEKDERPLNAAQGKLLHWKHSSESFVNQLVADTTLQRGIPVLSAQQMTCPSIRATATEAPWKLGSLSVSASRQWTTHTMDDPYNCFAVVACFKNSPCSIAGKRAICNGPWDAARLYNCECKTRFMVLIQNCSKNKFRVHYSRANMNFPLLNWKIENWKSVTTYSWMPWQWRATS